MLSLAVATTGAVLLTFAFTTLIHEPASIVTLLGIVVVSVLLDLGWKQSRSGGAKHVQLGH
jgi:threonine/homoserine/homoserine lactone efflux protein